MGTTFFIIAILYFLPTIIAFIRKKTNAVSILLLNLFLGWTLVGWVIALVWSTAKDLHDKN
jgi:threonine/homoserine/homoserine lactone efflux protein